MTTVFVTGAAYFNRGFDAAMVKEDLTSQNVSRQLSALYQVVAYMTMGKDMSSLFNEVSALTSSSNSCMKRLAYLYLVENSRVQPERTVLQAGTLVKDTLHDSPLVRGAALRTMTSIQLPMMADFDTGPLHRCLEDSSAYVRRIAAMGVVKQYAEAPNVSAESDVLDKLKSLLKDPNAMVVATTIRAMLELQYRNAPVSYICALLEARPHIMEMLTHGNEWSTVYLLEGLAMAMMWECHEAVLDNDREEAEAEGRDRRARKSAAGSLSGHNLAEPLSTGPRRTSASVDYATVHGKELYVLQQSFISDGEETLVAVLPLMQYESSIIVLNAIRVVALFLHSITTSRLQVEETERERLVRRYAPSLVQPLVELLESPRFEMRYVVLCNIVQFLTPQFTPYLATHLNKFLVKFEDPIYVKMQKLNLLVRLANRENGNRVLGELMVYTREPDAELVRTAISAIGMLATMLPELSEDCVHQLGLLIATRVPHLVEDTVVVVQMVLRRYPGKFTDILAPLCASLTLLETTEARAAVAWALGEYPDFISESIMEYLAVLVNRFMDQPRLVQYATMTALAKLYLRGARKVPGTDTDRSAITNRSLMMLEKVLGDCTDSLLPDLRDRAFFYWRLIALDPDVAQRVLAATEGVRLSSNSWDEFGAHSVAPPGAANGLQELGALSTVVSKPLHLLLGENVIGSSSKYLTGVKDDEDSEGNAGAAMDGANLSRNGHARPLTPAAPSAASIANDVAAGSSAAAKPLGSEMKTAFSTVLTPLQGNGVQVEMMWSPLGDKLVLCCRLSLLPGEDYIRHTRVITMQINWNMFGLGVAQVFPITALECGDKPAEVSVLVACNNRKAPTSLLQMAMELEFIGVRYVVAPPIPAAFLLLPATGCEPHFFAEQWRALSYPVWNMPPQLHELKSDPTRMTSNLLRVYCLNLVHRKEMPEKGLVVLLLYCETIGHDRLLVQATLNMKGSALMALTIRSDDGPVAAYLGEFIVHALCSSSSE